MAGYWSPDVPKEKKETEEEEEPAETKESKGTEKTDYDYLLGMPLWSLTFEKVEEIKKQLEAKSKELDIVKKTSIEKMWDRDLEALGNVLDEMDALEKEEAANASRIAENRRKKAASMQKLVSTGQGKRGRPAAAGAEGAAPAAAKQSG